MHIQYGMIVARRISSDAPEIWIQYTIGVCKFALMQSSLDINDNFQIYCPFLQQWHLHLHSIVGGIRSVYNLRCMRVLAIVWPIVREIVVAIVSRLALSAASIPHFCTVAVFWNWSRTLNHHMQRSQIDSISSRPISKYDSWRPQSFVRVDFTFAALILLGNF